MITLLSPAHLRRLLLAGGAAVTAELCAVGLVSASAWLIARAAQQPSMAELSLAIVAVRAFATLRGTFRYAERLAGHDAALRAVARVRERVYQALVDQPHRHRDGDGLARLVADADCVQDLLLRCLIPTAAALFVAASSIALCAVLLPAAGLVLAGGLVAAGVLVPAGAALAAQEFGNRTTAARAELAVRSLDLVDGARDLAAFGATGRARAAAERQAAILAGTERRAALVGGLATGAGVLVQGLTVVFVLLVALRSDAADVTRAVLGLTSLTAVEAVLPVGEAAQRWTRLRPAAERITALLRTPPPSPVPARARRSAGPIVLRGVTVDYGGRVALDAVDLRVEPGRSVAVVGASGAGKSTLLGVLAGLIEPHAGTAVLSASRALTQDAYVFHATVRANLVLARPDATEAQLAAAARQAGLYEWIVSLPDGWNTTVGEGGSRLSGGQRQRLVLARALLADPHVLLLDEPTEGLDPGLADEVIHRVLASRRGRATAVVTHRLAPLHAFDEIIVMDHGTVIDRGTHAHLVSRPGPYHDLWEAERLVTS